MWVWVSIRVRKELVDLADKMVKYGLAGNRSDAFNLMIEKDLRTVTNEIKLWEKALNNSEKREKRGFKPRNNFYPRQYRNNRYWY